MTPIDNAIALLDAGFHIIPLKSYISRHNTTPIDFDKSVKQAARKGWQNSNNSTEEEIAEWGARNYGILTRHSELVVLDGDSSASCEWIKKHMPPTPFMVKTLRGTHFYYRHRGELADMKSKNPALPMDIKASGYVVGPGCMRIDSIGNAYVGYQLIRQNDATIEDLPYLTPTDMGELETAIGQSVSNTLEIVSTNPFRFKAPRLPEVYDYCFPAADGQRFDACRDIIYYAVKVDELSYKDALARIEAWNAETTHPGASNGMTQWKYQLDWYWAKCSELVNSPTYGVKKRKIPTVITKKNSKPWELPALCQELPGALQLYVDHYMQTAPVPALDMAVFAALGFGSVVASRRYSTETGAHSSLYLCSIAGTGCGKNHAMTLSKRILRDADCEHLAGPNGYRSAGGLLSTLKEKPNHIAFIDEFGDEVAGLKGRKNPVAVDLWASIRTLYSSCGDHFLPSAYSREGKAGKGVEANSHIIKPGVSIFGLTTQAQLMGALSSAEVENGTLNRFIFNVNEAPRTKPSMAQLLKAKATPPFALTEWVAEVGEIQEDTTTTTEDGDGNKHTVETSRAAMEPDSCITVHYEDNAKTLIDSWPDLCPENELFARFAENAHRVMVILAVSSNPSDPVITSRHAKWSFTYLTHLYKRFSVVFGASHANSEWEEKVNTGLKLFAEIGAGRTGTPEGGEFGISKTRWSKRAKRYQKREREEILEQLIENGMVIFGKAPGARQARFYPTSCIGSEFTPDSSVTPQDKTE